ncbi:hypothetical protein LUZ60_016327 [Juncus effusus]|nr:hypothetical protein LUZ60_016327 [Juncus effusus]
MILPPLIQEVNYKPPSNPQIRIEERVALRAKSSNTIWANKSFGSFFSFLSFPFLSSLFSSSSSSAANRRQPPPQTTDRRRRAEIRLCFSDCRSILSGELNRVRMMSGSSNKRGAKRPALSDFSSDPSSSSIPSKRLMDPHRAESSNQNLPAGPGPLDPQRASSSQQHVRALNKQFASWVQLQLEKHPDELWEDGIKDYLSHAKQIMENFKDVVDWLKSNADKSKSVTNTNTIANPNPFQFGENKPLFGAQNNNFNNNNGPAKKSAQSGSQSTFSFASPGGSNEKNESPVEKNKPSLKLDINNGFSRKPMNTIFSFSTPQNSDPAPTLTGSSSQTDSNNNGSLKPVNFSFGENKSSQFSTGFSFGANSGQLNSPPFSFGQPPAFSGIQSFNTNNASKVEASKDDDDDETEEQRPSSPSLQKTEEKGVVIIHETKCKVYIKAENPSEKGWKDIGVGQLAIKTKEGEIKATKESKPTIVIRNDVGKILLNALIYSGIKTNVQKNTMTSVFHTADETGNVLTRTFLLRLKNADEATKLADTIKENSPFE